MTPVSIALNRFGLGLRRGEPVPANPRRWLEQQVDAYRPHPKLLAGRRIDGQEITHSVESLFALSQMRKTSAGGDSPAVMEAVNRLRQSRLLTYRGDIALRTRLAVESDTPFMERMVHFWSNHFAISLGKLEAEKMAGPYEFGAIRPHINGYFRDLLRAAALHPAMLIFLDQFQSQGPDSGAARWQRKANRPARGLNENLGREILELHTMGVDGGYTQGDVGELARALTGWTIFGHPETGKAQPKAMGAAFQPYFHQPGERRVLGRSYADNGPDQALAILDDLARHPSTARFLATKIARHFAGDDPPPAMVKRLARSYTQSDGHLPTVYRTLIASPEAWAVGPLKFRQPWEWIIGALRITGVDGIDEWNLVSMVNQLGQKVWDPGSPAGYDDRAGSWMAPEALYRRVEVAEQLARRHRTVDPRELARAIFPGALSETTEATIGGADSNAMGLALLLVSPEMMRR